jgi:RND family efflux transporter MFP subunit
MMSESGYVSDLEVEEKEFAVKQAELDVELVKTHIEVLKRFTKKEELATLQGNLDAAKAKHEADRERAYADEQRLKRAEEELTYCVVKADRSGMVIYPSARAWEDAPEIEEGATVHKDQVLLLMPDLSKMQVKVGIHESIIDRITPGLAATVTLPERTLQAKVSDVSAVTRPAGWWTGNVVKYDTIIELPPVEGLKPGMSAEVEVIMARHEDVLMIPAAAVVETNRGYACWVETAGGTQRRTLQLGDSSDMFIVVQAGLQEGEQVVLNPLAFIEEAQIEAEKTLDDTTSRELDCE